MGQIRCEKQGREQNQNERISSVLTTDKSLVKLTRSVSTGAKHAEKQHNYLANGEYTEDMHNQEFK